MTRYAVLLEISLAHAYYADERCRGLHFTPCAGTAAWLREIDARCRDSGYGLLVLGDRERLDAAATTSMALAWTLHCQDPQFAAVTEGLPALGDELMIFGSRPVQMLAEAGPRRLHPGATAGSGDIWWLRWPAVSRQVGMAQRRSPPLALVRVSAPTADATASGPVRYQIAFAARAPVWKYCLVGDWPKEALEVVAASKGKSSAANGESPFGEPVAERLPDGAPVLAFRSTAGIELRERSERRFKLRTAAAERVLVERLPVAGADHFAKDGKRTLVAEIYVHR